MIRDGPQLLVGVAPWVLEEEKESFRFSLVGFLKFDVSGTKEVESWLDKVWGKLALGV